MLNKEEFDRNFVKSISHICATVVMKNGKL